MSLEKTEGIVVRKIRWHETSNIVTSYTRDFGKIKLLAKGVFRPKSKLAGSLELFSLVAFVFYKKEKTELYTLGSADLLKSFPRISEDIKRYAICSAGMELLDRLITGEESNPQIFNLSLKFLGAVEFVSEKDLEQLLWAYALKLSIYLGYGPKIDKCVVCGKKFTSIFFLFSLERGGIVCNKCTQKDALYMRLSKESLSWLKKIQNHDFPKEFKISSKSLKEIRSFILDFISYHTERGGELKSLEFLKKIS
jgi:DNA repair protein RecO (recombination protein O)